MLARILLVEDDSALAQMLTLHFEDAGHEVFHALSLSEANHLVTEKLPDLVILDQGLPDGKGYDWLCQTMKRDLKITVIMMTAEHDLELAIAAIKAGAFDFIHKPIKTEELDYTVARALEHQQLARQVKELSAVNDSVDTEPRLIGKSQVMLNISKEIALVAESQARVLISGESGTGKELVARAIHHNSLCNGPFLAVNCAALVDNLLESELFGHERGAFTGATNRKPGKFELAANGTLFLDEIGEMALPLQAKLLRVLQEGMFERVGGSQQLQSNARVIAATNRILPEEIAKGRFREDLYYRINALEIQLPPLRERREDLPLLIDGLLQGICRREGKPPVALADGALASLKRYSWPGNIRELENVLTQAVIRCRISLIHSNDLNLKPLLDDGTDLLASSPYEGTPLTMAEVEARHIQYALDYCAGHKGKTCKVLGISRPALDRKIERYNLNADKPSAGI